MRGDRPTPIALPILSAPALGVPALTQTCTPESHAQIHPTRQNAVSLSSHSIGFTLDGPCGYAALHTFNFADPANPRNV